MSVFMTVVSVCVGYLVFIVFLWLFPVIAKLENPLRVQIKNAAAMAVAHFFPYTLFVSVIVLAAGYMAYTSIITDVPVSYTHLDVYKRQEYLHCSDQDVQSSAYHPLHRSDGKR